MSTAIAKAKLIREINLAACAARVDRVAADGSRRTVSLTGRARAVLGVLVGLSWPHDDGAGWAASLSMAELADQAGCSERQLRRVVADLEAAGLVGIARGGGRSSSLFVLRLPDRGGTPATGQGGHRRPGRADTRDRSTSSRSGLNRFTTTAPGGGGGWTDPAQGLDGRAAVAYELLARRPAWYSRRDWLDARTARRLALLETTTPTVVRAALSAARARADSLRPGGVPGFVVRRVETPDLAEIDAERRRQAAEADRDRRGLQEAERRRDERRAAEAIAEEAARFAEAQIATLGEAEVERIVADFVETASPIERAVLANRTTAERLAWLRKRGRLGLVLATPDQEASR